MKSKLKDFYQYLSKNGMIGVNTDRGLIVDTWIDYDLLCSHESGCYHPFYVEFESGEVIELKPYEDNSITVLDGNYSIVDGPTYPGRIYHL